MNSPTDDASGPLHWLGRALEQALNQMLRMDPQAAEGLSALEGQTVELTWRAPDWGLRLWFQDGRVRVGPRGAAPALALRANLEGLIGFLPLPGKSAGPTLGKVHVQGDVELAQRLQRWLASLQPEVDAIFSRVFGELYGPGVAHGARATWRGLRHQAELLREDLGDYLREDSGLLVTRLETDEFADAVDQLRDQTERLQARLARYRDKRGTRA